MNKEIKFRAWDEKENRMIHFDEMGFNAEYNLLRFGCDWDKYDFGYGDLDLEDDAPVMQYTGLKDKNGVEIYEGDIVRGRSDCLYSDDKLYNHEVKWEELHELDYPIYSVGFSFPDGELEVIGNIYENPDLPLKRREVDERQK